MICQEDINGEKLTMRKWWIFGADLFHGLRRVFHGFIRDVNGAKTSRYLMIFFTVSFSRFTPSRIWVAAKNLR